MKQLTIKQLTDILSAQIICGGAGDAAISGVSIDSRTTRAGDCFFAIKGENFDGNEFIDNAISAGAVCCVTDGDIKTAGPAILKVNDSIESLAQLAKWYRNQMRFKVVAITGSAGKTTTREIIYHVLSQKFACHQSPKSFNNNLGVPLTLLGAGVKDEIVVAELGSNRPGEIEYLANIAEPDIAIITNIYPAHLEGFGSIAAIVKEKAAIAKGLKPDGKLLINSGYSELLDYCGRLDCEVITFAADKGQTKTAGLCGEIIIDRTKISVPFPGKANLENVLAAWAVCKQFAISSYDFAKAVQNLKPPRMRMQIQTAGPITIINDCYNANPASMANAIDFLAEMAAQKGQRSVFICGQMAELGPQSEQLHRQLGQMAAAKGVKLLLVTGQFAETVVKAADGLTACVFANTDELCDNLQRFLQSDDIVLVKGSRSAGLENVIEKLVNTPDWV
jgi:UDP-N-acetylmuramoyl-tripeptide--D-alanyl-D-alanine ligase